MAYLNTYIRATDIQAVDPYFTLNQVQSHMAQAAKASNYRKPVWAVPKAFPYPDLPSPEYVRANVYISLISGAKGIWYFAYDYPVSTPPYILKEGPLWEPIIKLNGEIKKLSPWLMSSEPMEIQTSDSRVIAACFKGEDNFIVLAVNKSESDEVDFKLELPKQLCQARSLFNDVVLPFDSTLTLHLKPYGTTALKLALKAEPVNPKQVEGRRVCK